MRCVLLWSHFSLLLVLVLVSADLTASISSCPSHCGNISIPYPFGIGKGCYVNEWFAIQCNNSTSGDLVPYLPKINKEVVKIFLPEPDTYGASNTYGSLRIKTNVTSTGCSNTSNQFGEPLNFTGSPFTIGSSNTFQAIGCNFKATLTHLEPRLVGCISTCEPRKIRYHTSCRGNKCCQAEPPSRIGQVVGINMEEISSNKTRERGCRVAFLTDENRDRPAYPLAKFTDPQWFYDRQYVILQLRWAIPMNNISFINSLGCIYVESSKYIPDIHPCICTNNTKDRIISIGCACHTSYTGNPYVLGGCEDIDECQINKNVIEYCKLQGGICVNTPGNYECVFKKNKTHVPITIGLCVGFGVLMFSGLTLWLYKYIKKQRKINRKKKLFKRNGGLLLKQQLTSTEGNLEKTKVFTSKELEKATENFSTTRVLGQGGQGTVYKGMLVDGRIVAVKKSTVVDQDKVEEFINEVVILSQINHRNIVKLIGCCLETEVPLLVYEFVSNGNLFEHLHGEIDESAMTTWEMRLRIVIDIAGALSYLHSAAASPIFHRDVKSTNIMLDEKYRAKVSDFGTSRSVTVDHTHLTTVVSGTVGYVDPEYFQSSQFTDKSDVYSFGVVLVELITGEKPISFVRFQKSRTLATYFILAMEENRLVDIIDPRIRDGCNHEQVMAAAQLARRCLNLNGRNRPSMREVSMELERIRSPNGDSQYVHNVENNAEDVAWEIDIGVQSCNNVGVSAPSGFQYNVDTTTSSDVEPLFPRQTW